MDASVPITTTTNIANIQVINAQPPQSIAVPVNSIPSNTFVAMDILRRADTKTFKDDSDSEDEQIEVINYEDDSDDEDFGKRGPKKKKFSFKNRENVDDIREEVFVIPEREEGKRAIKGRSTFSPDAYEADKKERKKTPKGEVVKKVMTKWETYKRDVKQKLRIITRDTHMIQTYQTQTRDRATVLLNDKELVILQDKLLAAKKQIKEIFNKIATENKDDKVWHELAQDPDKEGLGEVLNISHIRCSKCGGDDEEGNDILFCDCKGCYRVYHQNCLDPPVAKESVPDDEPWFCWPCETLDDCLDFINEDRESIGLPEFSSWQDIYPEVDASIMQKLQDDADDEEDEDYLYEGNDIDSDGSSFVDKGNDGNVDNDNDLIDDEYEYENDNEDESSNNNNNNDDNNNDDNDECSVESVDIDCDELDDLLRDAGIDPISMLSSTRKLRDKVSVEADIVTCSGIPDIGSSVAKVARGIMVLGVIIEFKNAKEEVFTSKAAENTDNSADTNFTNCWWTVRWDDIKEENDETLIEYEAHEIIELMKLYLDYEKTNNSIDEKYIRHQQFKMIVAQEGIIDEANIVDKKRSRKEVDYATLSMNMFGNLHDDGELERMANKKRKGKPDDDLSAEDNDEFSSKKRIKSKPRPINPVTTHVKKEEIQQTQTQTQNLIPPQPQTQLPIPIPVPIPLAVQVPVPVPVQVPLPPVQLPIIAQPQQIQIQHITQHQIQQLQPTYQIQHFQPPHQIQHLQSPHQNQQTPHH